MHKCFFFIILFSFYLKKKSSRKTHNGLQQVSPHRPILLNHLHPRDFFGSVFCFFVITMYFISAILFFKPWLKNPSVSSNKGVFCWGNLLINRVQPYTQVATQLGFYVAIFVYIFWEILQMVLLIKKTSPTPTPTIMSVGSLPLYQLLRISSTTGLGEESE